jgi:hypothetical protein
MKSRAEFSEGAAMIVDLVVADLVVVDLAGR